MAETLTSEQRLAVQNRGGKLLVSAAAGSGKTKVLVDRLMGYLMDPVNPANIDDFLMITYTKAAASELRGKIAAKLSEHVANDPNNRHLQRQLQRLYLTRISTVHAFCADVLREYAYRLDIPGDFRVADENECREIRETVVQTLLNGAYLKGDSEFLAFVDSQGLGRDDRLVPDIIQQVYDSARCHLQPDAWLARCSQLVDTDGVTDASETLYGQFLMDRLSRWLELQIGAMERCAQQVARVDGGEKVGVYLETVIVQLRSLSACGRWDAIVNAKEVDFGRLIFPKGFDPALKEQIKAVRDACKKGLEKQTRAFANPSAQILEDLGTSSHAVKGLLSMVVSFADAYTKAKRSRRVLDFGDLEHKMLDLLLGKQRSAVTAAANEIGNRFREVMVDEYQDSNQVQDAIYNALTAKQQNLFLVGDVKQSIYQFRLADPGIFLEKYASFVPAENAKPGQGRKVLLSRNFRSSGGVLSGCNDVFKLCMCPEVGGLFYGPDEALYEGVSHVALPEAETALYCVDAQQDTYQEEAAFVVSQIQNLLDGTHFVREGNELRTVRPEDIAILLRSPGSAGVCYMQALERVGIRYAAGGGVDLLQTEEVSTLRSLLQVIQNPLLDIPLISVMASPLFGFTADDLAAIRGGNKLCSFYESLQAHGEEKSIDFVKTLSRLRQVFRKETLTGLLEEILVSTGMDGVYAAMDGGRVRMDHLQTFYQLAADFESGGNRDLGRFLEYLDTMEEKGLITAGDQSAPGCVTIMSIHKSKGLEFPVVFLCGLSREFNTESQRSAVLCHKDMGLGLSAVDTQNRLRYPTIAKRAISAKIAMESVSEELRVLYVAMTRARDRLIMTYASKRLQQELTEIVQRMDAGGKDLLIREAVCPGDWVLLTALQRTEAGALFALAGRPTQTLSDTTPWDIQVVKAPDLSASVQEAETERMIPVEVLTNMKQGLSFRYAHAAATQAPSKQTATQRKGRVKDAEAAENTHAPKNVMRQWRKPGFAQPQSGGKEYGNAMHACLQYIDYAACTGEAAIAAELQRLVEQRYISKEQGARISPVKLARFFDSPWGKKLRSGNVIREFKFSILEDGCVYDPALSGEQVLLQGVVDCALIEEDGITVIDFKTDYVTSESLQAAVDRYKPQVGAYAQAMERIYQKKVNHVLLYFFHMDAFAEI